MKARQNRSTDLPVSFALKLIESEMLGHNRYYHPVALPKTSKKKKKGSKKKST